MEHGWNGGMEGGNTSPLPTHLTHKVRPNPSKNWVFTWNNYDNGTLEHLYNRLEQDANKYVIGKEVGESGTPHIQGWVVFKVRKRPIEWAKIPGIHWERQVGTDEQASEYCMKDGDFRSKGINTDKLAPVKDRMKDYEYKEWQQEIMDLIKEEPDERSIHWYWEPRGKIGKTTFAKHICLNNRKAIYCSGKAEDIKCLIKLRREKNLDTDVVIFGYPRTVEGKISYKALEEIKDGIFFSGKYEPEMLIMNNPHVIVMTNFPPDESKMSTDRWVIRRIGE